MCQHIPNIVQQVDVLKGKSVRFPGPDSVPHGAELSASADQGRSGGHRKAAGPISSAADTETAMAARPKAKEVNLSMTIRMILQAFVL